jgi:MFS family permease
VFGILSDRIGRWATILIGQVLLVASLLSTALGSESEAWVAVGLILLGLGWSAATVAGSALLTESVPPPRRTILQGRSDLVMSASGAAAGALSGLVLTAIGYSGLSFAALGLVAIVVVLLMLTPRAGARPPAGTLDSR